MLGYRNSAVAAAIEAGQAILDIYHSGDFDVTVKGDDSPLTRADVAAHEVIVRHLIPTGIPVLSEEGRNIPFEERKAWRELWVVDPIDGTKEFIKRNGEFTVNIALIRDGRPVLGVIYVPVTIQTE
ncbi:MAG: inositol monophosphatase family protein, partial [Flavobacteriales bacterium]|nr:inositol monophosphatase family protein [Flavobacteriales bacterium]